MRLPKTERFTDDCKKCGWCPEKENSTTPLGDCGLCFSCMDKFVETAVSHAGMDGCSTGDCPHDRESECVASQSELVSEQAALLDARAGRIQRQNKMLMEKDARIAELEAVVKKLPVTADGVPVVPGVVVHWMCGTHSQTVASYRVTEVDLFEPLVEWDDPAWAPHEWRNANARGVPANGSSEVAIGLPDDFGLYSTREAALAARREEQR